MKFSYNWLQSYFLEKLPEPENLAEILSARSFEVEEIKKNNSDFILDISVLPNRISDCASHFGIAKELSAILELKLETPSFEFKKNENLKTEDYVKVEIKDEENCQRYVACLIKGVKVKDSPEWLKERLLSVGQKPINNIVDSANYAMLETGQPFHIFDLKKLKGGEIIIRSANDGESIETLDNKLVELKNGMLVIADEKDPLAIAGIKGGKKAEISSDTEDIIIESAIFNPISIRKVSRAVNIKTDASFRFEHGISFFLAGIAINRLNSLIQEVAGGEVADSCPDVFSKKEETQGVILKNEDIEKLLGEKIEEEKWKKILNNLGFTFEKEGENYFIKALIERTDISIKEDIIEEIGRVYGYENISAKLPKEIIIPSKRNDEYFYSNIIKDILVSFGYSEIYSYSLVKNGISELKLKNHSSPDRAYLRENLSDGLKKITENNLKNFESVKIFEIGKVFFVDEEEIKEKTSVCFSLGIRNKNKKEEIFFELKGVVEKMFFKLGIGDFYFSEGKEKTALIFSGSKELGWIDGNECEINLNALIEIATEDLQFKPISKFPAIVRDISLFVPVETKVSEVMDIIENSGGELLIDTDLFDIYILAPEKEEVGKKSLAFRMIFQSNEKTLTDEEVNKIRDKIISSLEEKQWQVRK